VVARTGFPGTSTTGITHTAANDNNLPGGWIGYVQVVANQSSITGEADLTGLSQAITVNTNRRIKVTGKIQVSSTVSTDSAILRIKEGATQLQQGRGNADNSGLTIQVSAVLTPTAGSHTYKLSLERDGTGSATMQASSTVPAFLLIEDIGPAS
jgi:hypothetical protein